PDIRAVLQHSRSTEAPLGIQVLRLRDQRAAGEGHHQGCRHGFVSRDDQRNLQGEGRAVAGAGEPGLGQTQWEVATGRVPGNARGARIARRARLAPWTAAARPLPLSRQVASRWRATGSNSRGAPRCSAIRYTGLFCDSWYVRTSSSPSNPMVMNCNPMRVSKI